MLKKLLIIVTLLLVLPALANAAPRQGASHSCKYCHIGNIPVGGGASGCGGCHVNPPHTGAHLPHTDGSGAIYGSDANGSAAVYSFNCGNCHSTDPAMHGNGNVEVELYSASATGLKRYNPATAGSSGAGLNRVCSNIYCHSSGLPAGVNTYAATPMWGGTFSGNRCAGCHSYPPAYANNAPKANSHVPHDFSCDTCHAGTTTSGTAITNPSLHVNGSYDLAPGNGVSFTYTYAAAGGTCSSISCHGNTDATWGGTAVCTACHGSPPPQPAAGYTGVDEATSPHLKHAGNGANYGYACSECHKGNKHGNGTFQDIFIDKSGIIAGTTAVYSAGSRTCSALYCHSDGSSVASGQATAGSAVWGSGKLGCNGCHGNAPDYANGSPKANSHAKHMAYGYSCSRCHYATTTTGTAITDTSRHVNRGYDVSAPPATPLTYAYSASGGTCSANSCHNDGTVVATGVSVNRNATWGGTVSCSGCHASPPTYANESPKANSHLSHNYGCGTCHGGTTADGTTIADKTRHGNGTYDVAPGSGVAFSYSFAAGGGNCSNISCHGNTSATWGGSAACIVCHSVAQGNRGAITAQFSANSHHIQGTVSNTHCYQCHWEANSDGSTNAAYHHSKTPGAPVELVIYGVGSRPATYSAGVTAVQYTANGARGEIQKINSHCLGCHSDQNNATTPFGDGKTPRQYAWDGTSVAARYAQSGATTWGKYPATANAAQKNIGKAYSAHGNPAANGRGWDTTNGVDGPIANTSGAVNVLCYDCHNSHGSTVAGVTTRYTSATANGGILKDTVAGQGGYAVAYKPSAGGSAATKSNRNPGASLCLDCHLNQTAAATPWGFNSTYGATQPVLGYWDAPMYNSYSTAGPKQRYPYKKTNQMMGGHFGASLPLSGTPTSGINGLCTPCHDPHGVSPTLGANQQYAVPLLKGSWLTSPYKEDVAPSANNALTNFAGYGEGVQYHIDQNTFGPEIRGSVAGITQSVDESAGLCLGCHPKNTLTAQASPTSPNPWKSRNRVHESVKGWKSSDATVEHNYSCSKCHSPHSNSVLPRLMVTNCLDGRHKGRSGYNPGAVTSGSSGGDSGSGSGRIPGSYGGSGYDEGYSPNKPGPYVPGDVSVTCHDSSAANGSASGGTDQGWNSVTPWIDATPTITSAPTAVQGNLRVLLHMDEAGWNGTPNEVKDSSGGNNNGTAYSATSVAGGISGRAGSFNGSYSSLTFNYSSGTRPVDNFTMEAWIKPTTTHGIDAESNSGYGGTSGQRYLFWPDPMGADGGAGISAGTNGISVYEYGDGYMPALAVYSGAISSSQWTHIAVVYANKQPSIYVNGVLVRTGLQSQRAHVYAPRTIGGYYYGYFPGLVDEVAIYDRAISGTDIALHTQLQCPAISGSVDATINWGTITNATSYVDYGLTSGYGSTMGNDSLVTNHSVTLTNLLNHSTYHYRVRSTEAGGREVVSGDYTFNMETCVVAEPPPAPTGISASAGSGQATVSWAEGGASTTSLIRYGTTSGVYTTTLDPATSPQTITGLTNGAAIYYQVGARNANGTTWSAQYSVTPLGAPTAITAVPGNSQATISWSAGSGSTSSLIRYGTVSGSYTTTIDPATSPRVITALANGVPVYYQVGAKNAAGITWSGENSVTPVAPPQAPTGISATGGNNAVTISWTAGIGSTSSSIRYGTTSGSYPYTIDPATSPRTITGLANGVAIYFQVGAKNAGGTTWSVQYSVTPVLTLPAAPTGISATVLSGQATISWTAGTGSTSSQIRYGTVSGTYTTTIDPASSPRAITGLTNGTTYYYQVGAKNTAGTTWSAQNSVMPVGAPTNIVVTPGNGQATVSWTAGVGSTSSLIRYGTVSGTYTTIIDPANSPQVITGLTNGVTIYLQVGAKNAWGTSWSGQYSVVPTPPPTAPTGISAVPGNAYATVSWTAGTGSTSSVIRYGTVSGTYTTTIDPATSPRTVNGLANGVTTYYQVGAKNGGGTAWSGEYSVTPMAPPAASANIAVTAGDGQATIAWTPGSGATSSLIRYGTTTGVYTTTIDPAASPYSITGLTNGTPLYYQIGSRNVLGTTWSAEYSFTVTASNTQTLMVSPGTYSYLVPAGVTAVTAIVKGGGGAGGLNDSEWNLTSGTGGNLVSTVIPVTPGSTLTVTVSSGGYTGGNYIDGGAGGSGYHAGAAGSSGEGDGGEYAYGGGGGGGSSAITLASTLLAEAKGGSGGRSSDYYSYDYEWYYYAGEGGAGGGSDYPATTTAGGGGAGGVEANGGAGSVAIIIDQAAPSAPAAISATVGNGQTTINWTAGTGSSSSIIRYGTASGNYTSTIDPATSPQTITGLTNGTPVYYQVGAKNSFGTTWSGENSVTPMAAPSAPTGISATAGNAQVTITWTAGVGAASSLIRYGTVSGSYPNSIDPATSPQAITGLANGTPIFYQVGAKNAAGTTWSVQYSVTPTLTLPLAPTGISAVAGNAQGTITWTAGTDSTSSLLRYGTVSGTYTTTIDPATSPRTITSLTNGTTIYYQVGAKNTAGTTWSAQYSVTPVAPPVAPTGISAIGGNTQGTISWIAGTGSTSSLIRYGTTSGTYTTTLDPAASPYTISSLVNGTTIYCQVGAKNASGTTWSVQYSFTPALPPSAPTGISASVGNSQVTISWSAGSGSTSSLIKYGTTSGNYTITVDPAVTPQTIAGLTNGTAIYYQVGARNGAGTSWSAEYNVTPAGPASAPTGISVTSVNTQATISWTAGSGAASSLIRYGTATGIYTTTIDPAVSPQTIIGLTNGTPVYYQIGSRNVTGTTWSVEYSFTVFASSTQTLMSSPGTYTYVVPAGVTAVTAIVRGGGGGGGLNDSEGNQASGANGNLVTTVIPVTPGSTLTVNVSNGGYAGGNYTDGGAGGSGYHAGSPGTNGNGDGDQYAYGGAGGGGSSAITLAAVRLAEAQGGSGGRSSDYYSYDYEYYYYAGEGGAGGGSDYPATTTSGGGGSGGIEADGGNGSVAIIVDQTPPAAAIGISATAGNGQTTITWTAGSGSTSSLIRYGTVSGVYATTLDPATSPRTISGLVNGTAIYYQVGAKNGAGTTWSAESSVTPMAPPSAPTGVSATAGNAQGTISWSAGSGSTSSLIRYGTVSGTYTTTIDPATSPRTITSLTNGTTIYYQVGAKNAAGTTWSAQYSFTPVAPPAAPALASPTATTIGSTTATLGANVTSNGGAALTARGTVWGTSANPTGNAVAEGGSATGIFTHGRTGVTAATKIYYRGYATNSAGTGYSPDGSFYTEPSGQASAVNFTAVGTTGMTVNWTRGNGDGVIVLIKQGSAVNSDPVDGTYTGYAANSTFGSGTQIGTGNYVIYKGAGTSVAVTGLTAGTTYYLAVYEYKGTLDTSGVNQGTNYKLTPVTGSQATGSGAGAPAAPALAWPYSGYAGQVGYPEGTNLLQWDASPGATEYYCEIWSDDGGDSSDSGWTATLSFDPGDLTDNYNYNWRVRARNAIGESDWSETRTWNDEW